VDGRAVQPGTRGAGLPGWACAAGGWVFKLGAVHGVMTKDAVPGLTRHGVAMAAGLCLALAFPPTGWAGLAWVGPALMLLAGQGCTVGQRWRLGYLAGWIQHGLALAWLWEIPVRGYPVLGWAALVAYLALYPAAWLACVGGVLTRARTWRGRTLAGLGAGAVWVALEMLQARLLGGFPWNLLGASQFEMIPLIQLVSVTGIYGLSFLMVWTAVGLWAAARAVWEEPFRRHGWMRELALPGLAVLVVFGWGWQRVREYSDGARLLRVTVVQPSIPQTWIWDARENEARFRALLDLTRRALEEPTDLLVWPEAAVPMWLRYDPVAHATVCELARQHGVWMITGSDDAEPRDDGSGGGDADYFNAAFLVGPDGRLQSVYRKMQLVMFGEYIPWVDVLPFLRWFTPITGQYTPGREPIVFELAMAQSERASAGAGVVRAAPLICFEDVFPHLARRFLAGAPDLFVNLTNDGWFGQSAAQWQHAANAVFRAVETGRPLVRCTNNGLSAWVDPLGRIRAVLRDERGTVYGPGWAIWTVPLPERDLLNPGTVYARYGDVWGWICVAGAGLWAVGRLRGRWRANAA